MNHGSHFRRQGWLLRLFLNLTFVTAALGYAATRAADSTDAKTDASAAKLVYDVRSYGATGDGKTLDGPAISKTIEACADAGGGTVYVPAGTYLSGSIRLKSNIHLFIDAGATILGAPQSIIDLGSKVIYRYSDLKVTFIDGKVTDVD